MKIIKGFLQQAFNPLLEKLEADFIDAAERKTGSKVTESDCSKNMTIKIYGSDYFEVRWNGELIADAGISTDREPNGDSSYKIAFVKYQD